MKYIGQIAKIENKKKVAIFLDLLPGDDKNNQRNFEAIEFIINNSLLSEFQTDALRDYELETIGYGYGTLNQSTKDFKNDFEFVITDWVVQSFHSLLKYEMEGLDISSEAFQLSKLAKFLLNEKRFEIRNAFNLVNN